MSPTQLARSGVQALLGVVGREVRGMHEAAYLLAAFALLSQALGLLRDRLLAGSFGASHTLDVYYAAFRIPDFLFATIASMLSLYALLPVLSRLEAAEEGSANAFVRNSLLLFFVGMGGVSLLAYALAPVLVPLVAPGIAGTGLVELTRILLLQPILLGASNIVASLTQLRHRFFLYSISPILYNLGIIIGVVFFYPQLGIAGLGWGVVLGALLHLLVQLPFFGAGASISFSSAEFWKGVREVLLLSVPRTLALSAGQLSLLFVVALASLFSVGSISIFMFAWNLQSVPLAIIGVSYSVAAFPTLSRLHASGAVQEFVRHIEVALRHILFWAIPASVFTIVLRAQLVRVILGSGAFDWTATRLTAAALAILMLSLCAQALSLLIARGYYAAGRTAKPLQFAGIEFVVSVISALLLVALFQASPLWRDFMEALLRVGDIGGTTVLMLALALTLGALAKSGWGLYSFVRDFSIPLRDVRRVVFQSFSASVIGAAVSYAVLSFTGSLFNINTLLGVFLEGALAGVAGILVMLGILLLLKNAELREAIDALRRRFVDSPPIVVETTDVSS